MEVREQIAEFLSALIWVYVIILIAWIVVQFVFSMGARVPYSRAAERSARLPARRQ